MSVPLVKLGYLLVRQLAKPLANRFKTQAKQRPWFRATCVRLAQAYHNMDVRMRSRLFETETQRVIRPLDEERAIDMGANFFGEFIVFAVAGAVVYAEASRSKNNAKQTQDDAVAEIEQIKERLRQLELKVGIEKLVADKPEPEIKSSLFHIFTKKE